MDMSASVGDGAGTPIPANVVRGDGGAVRAVGGGDLLQVSDRVAAGCEPNTA